MKHVSEGGEGPTKEFNTKHSLKSYTPYGDLSERNDKEYNRFFKRQIKAKGKTEHASTHLPSKKADPMAGGTGK